MFRSYFELGGPVMWVLFAAWVVVLAGVLDRLFYAAGRIYRSPLRTIRAHSQRGEHRTATMLLARERHLARRGLERIETVSQLATSIGLFGTVLGLARSFFAREGELGLAAAEVLASGLATALFTTIAGLVVFLFGQGFLILWREWEAYCERDLIALDAQGEGSRGGL